LQLIVIVLNKVEKLEDLLTEFAKKEINGATIFESTGMARVLGHHEDLKFFGTLRMMINPEREESKTIFVVLEESKIPVLKEAVKTVLGDISKPDTGIIFGLPVSFVDGIGDISND